MAWIAMSMVSEDTQLLSNNINKIKAGIPDRVPAFKNSNYKNQFITIKNTRNEKVIFTCIITHLKYCDC